ncbi:MAG: hypothetical protein ABSC57_02235 [Syntrophales bacterium]
MKTRMNKLAVFVMMAAIVMFTGVAMGQPAGLSGPSNAFYGVYAVNGVSQCVIAPTGFTNLVPNLPAGLWINPTTFYEAVVTFYPAGYGTFRALGHFNEQYGPSTDFGSLAGVWNSGSESINYDFTYTVAKDGAISFTIVPCTYAVCTITPEACSSPTMLGDIPHDGVISPDRTRLTITCGAPVLLPVGTCSGGKFTGSGTQAACNIALSGFRVNEPIPEP